ncbi:hypothetical protein KJ564_10015, partial [bacterium]|nr:hypothetical protein [bacterium]
TYSEKTTYNYYCLAEYLKYFYQVGVNNEPLSTEALKNVDVLIIKIPTQPYAESEIEAVEQFVEQGGGVWVIGDHTNVFGSSSYLNPLLKRFGCRLRYDSTHDLKTGKLSLWERPRMFAHPSVAHLPPYLFATSCSVTAPLSAENAIIGYGLRKDYLDYSQRNFFPDRSKKLFDIGFGLFLQQAAVPYGKGRLLIYTDSTTFSNFFMFIRGKPEIVLGAVDWVNRANRLNWLNRAAFWSALVILLLLIVLHAWNGAAIAGLLTLTILSGWFIDHKNTTAYPPLEPVREIPYINFDRQLSQYFLPTLRLMESGDRDFHTFFVWTQRVGAVPREVYDLDQALTSKYPLVLIDPSAEIPAAMIDEIDRFVRDGGKLLLIHSADIIASSASRMAQKFGLSLQTELTISDTTHTVTLANRFFPLRLDGKVSTIGGGEPFWHSDQGDVIGATIEVGKGKVWFVSAGHLFRNEYMGSTTLLPDEGLKALFQVEYGIILDMMRD